MMVARARTRTSTRKRAAVRKPTTRGRKRTTARTRKPAAARAKSRAATDRPKPMGAARAPKLAAAPKQPVIIAKKVPVTSSESGEGASLLRAIGRGPERPLKQHRRRR